VSTTTAHQSPAGTSGSAGRASGRSIYESFPSYPFRRPPEMAGVRQRHPVVIVGAGPVGLTLACGLAHHGVPCVVLEPRGSVSFGSRASCLSRRSLEIWERFGVAGPILEKGLAWTGGHSFWHGHEVLEFTMPVDADQKHPPMVNLQQCFVEQYLLDGLAARPDVDLRWHSTCSAIEANAQGAALRVDTPEGSYQLEADYVVAADGARSPIRQALGLRLEGNSYEGRYLIADILLRSGHPTERRAWFDPPSNPGSTVLMHRQPEDLWRVDYQLRDDEDDVAEQREDRVRARIDAHLTMIGETSDYELVWISLYKAHCLTLPRFRHGRVLFAGDAAHLVPIFGVRGLNSGIDDAGNLAWKLAACVQGPSGRDILLESYSEERVFAARENIRQARKSTLFMTPPTAGHVLLREAALSLAVSNAWARPLINPRQTTAISFPSSPLQTPDSEMWTAGPAPGSTLPTFPVRFRRAEQAWDGHLLDALGPGLTVFLRAGDPAAEATVQAGSAALVILAARDAAPTRGEAVAVDARGRSLALLGLEAPGSGYLVRPDGHVAARWHCFAAQAFMAACARALGQNVRP